MRSAVVVLAIFLAGCGLQGSQARIAVVASFYPLYEFARQVGGPRVEVRQLVPYGVSPHDFEPRPADVALLGRARVFVYNGAGLEPWVARLVAAELPADAVRVEATEGLPLLRSQAERQHPEGDGHKEKQAGTLDPHVWLDPVLAQGMVRNVTQGLVRADPPGAREYLERSRRLIRRLQELHGRYAQALRRCRSRVIITSHAAFGYLTRRYGLHWESVAGLAPEAEPSPRRLRELVELGRRERVQAVYAETLGGRPIMEGLAQDVGARVLVLDPLEGLSEADLQRGRDYFSVMEENLRQLVDGLGCR